MSSKDPLVSIITPTYNHEEFIEHCIKSVLEQTYSNWEMIIIDDGSTDKTPEICKSFSDKRINYNWQKNKGIWKLSENYNKGLSLSNGKYIAVLEGDDYWPKDKLEKQVKIMEKNDVILSHGKTIIVDENNKRIEKGRDFSTMSKQEAENKPIGKTLDTLLWYNYITPATVICKKENLVKIGGFKQVEGFFAVDYPTWLELSLHGHFYCSDKVLGYYRRHEKQATSKANTMTNMVNEGLKMCEYIQDDFYKRIPKRIKSNLDLDIEELKNLHSRKIMWRYFSIGRTELINGNWKNSRKAFISSLFYGKTPEVLTTKVQALFGIILSLVKIKFDFANIPQSGFK